MNKLDRLEAKLEWLRWASQANAIIMKMVMAMIEMRADGSAKNMKKLAEAAQEAEDFMKNDEPKWPADGGAS